MAVFSYETLRRFPDVEAGNLFAADASDRLILDQASAVLGNSGPGEVAVIGDHYGALTIGAAALHGASDLRVYQDGLSGELALANNAKAQGLGGVYRQEPLGEQLVSDATVVLLQLPRTLAELDEVADTIARYAHESVTVFAGGRIKHMTLAQNNVLRAHFGDVHATLARQKSRVLVATSPLRPTGASAYPLRQFQDELGIWVCASGAVFAGTKLDIGTRFLLGFLDQAKPDAASAIDLGAGTGVLATMLAKSRPAITVLATDQSAAAVVSTRATVEANGVADRVSVIRDTGLSSQQDASAELILLNPPFHAGATVHTGVALTLFEDAARVLRPGGELWTVFNSRLGYGAALARAVGPTRQVARNPKFTVTVSTPPPAG